MVRGAVGGLLASAVTALVAAALISVPASGATVSLEAETMNLSPRAGGVFSDGAASGGRALLLHSNATAAGRVTTPKADRVVVRARGDKCGGAPRMVVKVGRVKVLSKQVRARGWRNYAANIAPVSGGQRVSVSFTNDRLAKGCDRNLRVDKVGFVASTGQPPSGSDPFEGTKLYVDPDSNAKRQADEWRASRPADAALMDKISAQPDADWFGDWNGADVQRAVDTRVTTITNAGAMPVLVAYNLPNRDCSGQSAGGASSPEDYRRWIRDFADGIGGRKAAVVIEPDAVALTGCLSEAGKATRLDLIEDAVNILEAKGNVATYIDAGHSNWVSAAEMSARLAEAGIVPADGFSLNVSNFQTTASNVAYGKELSSKVGGDHFVIDTARNGLGPSPDNQWCNPPGRALGKRPTSATSDPLVDAYLWIKPPGESDGECNGGPPAGGWWPDYALGLAQRAAY